MKKEISLYIHIPFCVRKCLYCDFLSAPAKEAQISRYVELLVKEIAVRGREYGDYRVKTVYIGGGTPSLLSGGCILQIMTQVYRCFEVEKNCEVSLEANPGTVTYEKLTAWREAGVNRISLGLQSLQDGELKALGRIHDSSTFFATYRMVVESGFNNINIDLMSGIPGQSLESYKDTLKKVVKLAPGPKHISAYSLIVEEGTPFYENTPQLPDEECDREMYALTDEFLSQYGYCRYEISNYALPGYECRHNIVYWRRGNYLGLGLGAASLVENVRFCNARKIEDYGKIEEKQILSRKEQMEEFMFLGLRMTEGVSYGEFSACFGADIDLIYPGTVELFRQKGLLWQRINEETGEKRIGLTAYGMDVSNYVMAEFLLTV